MNKIKQLWNKLLALTFWKMVFWWKKKTGWLELHQTPTLTGTIVWVDKNVEGWFNDGDVTFHLQLDPGQEKYITGFGGRLTSADIVNYPATLHCEITPWMRDQFDVTKIVVGARVKVTGQWGFDGVHIGVPEWKEVFYALGRHQPNVIDGWFELHPVEKIEYLTDGGPYRT